MCGRYSLSPQESREIMDILQQVQDKFKTGEVFPTDPVPVLMEAGAELAPEVMVWGYPGVGGKGRATTVVSSFPYIKTGTKTWWLVRLQHPRP